MAVNKIEVKEYKWEVRDDSGKLVANARYKTGDSVHFTAFQENGIECYGNLFVQLRHVKAFAEMFPKMVQDIEEDDKESQNAS